MYYRYALEFHTEEPHSGPAVGGRLGPGARARGSEGIRDARVRGTRGARGVGRASGAGGAGARGTKGPRGTEGIRHAGSERRGEREAWGGQEAEGRQARGETRRGREWDGPRPRLGRGPNEARKEGRALRGLGAAGAPLGVAPAPSPPLRPRGSRKRRRKLSKEGRLSNSTSRFSDSRENGGPPLTK